MRLRLSLIVLLIGFGLQAQETNSFDQEVRAIVKRNASLWNSSQETVVFAGSSSIRFWKDLQERFPDTQVLNSGFGGSQASDLLVHLDDLVLRYKPKQVFIYEGDNDINAKKRPKKILETTNQIVANLRQRLPDVAIVLISAKPSLSRWKLRGKYRRLNKRFAKYAEMEDKVAFVDVWHPMLNGRKVRKDLFVSDGLHMNGTGYDIWYETIKNYVE